MENQKAVQNNRKDRKNKLEKAKDIFGFNSLSNKATFFQYSTIHIYESFLKCLYLQKKKKSHTHQLPTY